MHSGAFWMIKRVLVFIWLKFMRIYDRLRELIRKMSNGAAFRLIDIPQSVNFNEMAPFYFSAYAFLAFIESVHISSIFVYRHIFRNNGMNPKIIDVSKQTYF